MRRILALILAAFLWLPQTAHGVLKENDLDNTLRVLMAELESHHNDLAARAQQAKEERVRLQMLLQEYLDEASEVSLMVYSQQQDFIFDLTYACHQATSLYQRFHSNQLPFDTLMAQMDIEVARYEGLLSILNTLPVDSMGSQRAAMRDNCRRLANAIYRQLQAQQTQLRQCQAQYDLVDTQLNQLSLYANNRYRDIQNNIFNRQSDNYFYILKHFGTYFSKANEVMAEKYASSEASSQWKGSIVWMIFAIMLVYGLIAMLAGYLIWRYLLPRFTRIRREFDSQTNAIVCFAMSTFAIVVGLLNLVVEHNFIRMATGLLVQYAWLVTAIQLSLIVRLRREQEKVGLRLYAPLLIMGFVMIVMRVIFIPGAVIALYFPPLLLIVAYWQWRTLKKNRSKDLPKSDSIYSTITLLVMLASLVLSVSGRTFIAVELFIWWMMQLTCIQTITCFYDVLRRYRAKAIDEGATIRQTWFVDLINKTLLPITAILSFLYSLYWSADVFDMGDWVLESFMTSFLTAEGIIELSLWRLCVVLSLFYVTRYVMYFIRCNLRLHYGKRANGEGAIVIGNNLLAILVWGAYLIISMLLLHIGNSWILVITGGLSTGIGFAMKDTLENLFYGISLMLGRVHIGDIIECDGTRGTVSNISYQSTTIQAFDGSEIAFLNSQLFSKNFKNLTRNHNLELVIIPIGIAYGSNIEQVRKILTDAIGQLDCYDKEKGISIGFMDFAASSVDLKVCVWVEVIKKGTSVATIKETIYNTLNRHNIEIPFTQIDVHQR